MPTLHFNLQTAALGLHRTSVNTT